jgi:hypothetical protein
MLQLATLVQLPGLNLNSTAVNDRLQVNRIAQNYDASHSVCFSLAYQQLNCTTNAG